MERQCAYIAPEEFIHNEMYKDQSQTLILICWVGQTAVRDDIIYIYNFKVKVIIIIP